jgi:hypothetical protein
MALNIKNYTNYFILLFILLAIGFLYRRYEDKREREEQGDNYDMIQKYLLFDDTNIDANLAKNKKPILWLHITHEYNSRDWLSFGSRSSFELNQPYLYLTVKSIINQCDDSFHICIIDDETFPKLLPDWNINMKSISNPLKRDMRELAIANILYKYGGVRVPPSFICFRNLIEMYEKGTAGDGIFSCEFVDRNVTSVVDGFCPSVQFMGAKKQNPTIKKFIDFMERTISKDYTDEIRFLGELDRWVKRNAMVVDGKMIGTKKMDDEPVLLEDLLSTTYISIYNGTYGVLIPQMEILNRSKYQWFARLSIQQLLESNMIVSKYLLLANAPDAKSGGGVLENIKNEYSNYTKENRKVKKEYVSFWNVPSGAPLYGLQPLDLGDKVPKLSYPNN